MDEVTKGVNGNNEIIRKYPLTMVVVNDTGVDVEVAIISNEEEEKLFNDNYEDFFFLLPKDSSIGSSSRIGRAYKVSCRKSGSGTPTKKIRFDFMHHVGTIRIN